MLLRNASFTSIGSRNFARTSSGWRLCGRRRANTLRIVFYSFISRKSRLGTNIEFASTGLASRHAPMPTNTTRPIPSNSQPPRLSTSAQRYDTVTSFTQQTSLSCITTTTSLTTIRQRPPGPMHTLHHHQPDHLVTPNPHDEYKAAVLARDHAHRRQMEADANLHAVKTAHARSPTSDFAKHLTAARLQLAVASHKNDSKSISAREHKKGTSLDTRLGAARSSHVAAEKHVDEVPAVDVEKHAHHLKLAEEAHAHAARRKDHLERKRSHEHWAAEVSKADPGSEEHAYVVIRHHRATTRLIDSREAKIKHLAVELDKSKHLGGEDPSSRHHEHHESLSRRFEKQRAKLAREKEEHQALSRHRSDILKNRQMSHSDDVYRRQEHERAHREEEAVRHVQDEQEREAVREEHRKAEAKRAEHLKERRKDRREEKAREKAARASKAREKAEERAKHNHEGGERRAKKAEEKKERRANKHADWERRQKLHGEERKKADAAHAAERERKRKEKLAADAKHKEVKAAERARKAKEKERAREATHAEHLRHAREKEEEKRKAAAKRHREQQVKFERKRQKGKSRKAKKEARRWMKIPKVKKRKVRMPKGRKR
ncbi:hypothetical protein JCM10295v2_002157 [Rhodotorula toruloides]